MLKNIHPILDDVQVYQNTYFQLNYKIYSEVDKRKTAVDVTSWQISLLVKRYEDDPDEDALITIATADCNLSSDGDINIPITSEQTDLSIGRYFFAVKIVTAESKSFLLQKGTFEVLESVVDDS